MAAGLDRGVDGDEYSLVQAGQEAFNVARAGDGNAARRVSATFILGRSILNWGARVEVSKDTKLSSVTDVQLVL